MIANPSPEPADYRVFFLDREGRIAHAEPLAANNDAEAMVLAQRILRDAARCEVWNGARLVGKFDGLNGGILQPR